MPIALTGLGLATPRFQIAQQDACRLTTAISCDDPEQRDLMSLIYRHSGVQTRGSVVLEAATGTLGERESFFLPRAHSLDRGPGTDARMQIYAREALPLALRAARAALSEADCLPREITHVVVASCTGCQAPGVDVGLIHQLRLPPTTQRYLLGFMGCHGGFNALSLASAIIGADSSAIVLACAVELCSVHHFYGWDAEKVVANALFADGAGAAVCRSETRDDAWRITRHGSVLIEDSVDAMSWNVGDHGFEMALSKELPALIEKSLGPWIAKFLSQEDLSIDKIGSWAIHPGGPKILDACRRSLGIGEDQLAASREVLAKHGNMSSATIFFVMDQLRQGNAPLPIVALGFGPGLSVEAFLVE